MKITTLNHKNEDYLENHEIFVGTQTGSFKKICVADENPYSQKNLQNLKALTKDSKITALAFGDENKEEILIGRENQFAQTFSTSSNNFESIEDLKEGPIVGLARFGENIIGGIGNGKIRKNHENEPIIITGDSISRMRQCPTNKIFIATGGKDRQNNLKVFDIRENKEIFKSKNLPNDYLQLEVPVWDSDIGFVDSNIISTCSRYGYVRVYDIRKQRRPVLNYSIQEGQISFCSLIAKDNFIYCGSTTGVAKAFDIRKFKTFAHTYKGFTGSISDLEIDDSGKFLVSSSLDRYVRVHNVETCVMLYQCYVKSKATRVILKTLQKSNEIANFENEEVSDEQKNEDGQKSCSDEEYNEIFNMMPKIEESIENGSKSLKRRVGGSMQRIKKQKVLIN